MYISAMTRLCGAKMSLESHGFSTSRQRGDIRVLIIYGVLKLLSFPQSVNTDQDASTSTCSDLGWAVTGIVCGSATVAGSCHNSTTTAAMDHPTAEGICTAAGARLCSSTEILNNVIPTDDCGIYLQSMCTTAFKF